MSHPASCVDPDLFARVMGQVEKTESGCWVWQGYRNNYGYGQVGWHGKRPLVHRVMYELLVAPIPAGLTIDHLCRNRSCCNPAHLEPVSNKTNILRGASPAAVNASKTACKRGHPFDDENTYWTARGERSCLTCRRMTAREWARRRKGAL